MPDGSVYAIARAGSTVYLGGGFDHMGINTGNAAILDPTTGNVVSSPGISGGKVNALVPDGHGGYYAAGALSAAGGRGHDAIVHIKPDGTVDQSFTASVNGEVKAMTLGANQYNSYTNSLLYIGGQFTTVNGQPRKDLAALTPQGELDSSWVPSVPVSSSGSGNPTVTALAASAGEVFVGGLYPDFVNLYSYRDSDGGLLIKWPLGGASSINALAVQHGTGGADDTLYIGGQFTSFDSDTRSNLASLDTLQSAAGSWAPTADGPVQTLALSGSTVYVGGSFSNIDGTSRSHLAAVDASSGALGAWTPAAPDAAVSTILPVGSTVYIGGQFKNVGSTPRAHLAGLDSGTGSPTSFAASGGADAPVSLLANIPSQGIFAGGDFRTMQLTPRQNLAAVDASSGDLLSWNPGTTPKSAGGDVLSLATANGVVYAGGDFTTLGGQARSDIGAVDGPSGAATSWNPGANSSVSALALSASGSTIYAGGIFTSAGGQARAHLAELDLASGAATAWNPGPDDQVNTLVVNGGTVYAGGFFHNVAGVSRRSLAALDASTGATTAWDPEPDNTVFGLAKVGSTIYVGGNFTNIGGQARPYLASVDAASGAVSSWNPGLDSLVNQLSATATDLYVAGNFSTAGGQPRTNLAAFDIGSGLVDAWNPSPDPADIVWTVLASGTSVYVGGDFFSVGNLPQAHFAEFQPPAPTSCDALRVASTSVPTRNPDMTPAQATVTESATKLTQGCQGALQVPSGGKFSVQANPPAYQQVTGFHVLQSDGSTLDVPADGSPGPGQQASGTIWITQDATVTPVTSEHAPPCQSVTVAERWLGSSTQRTDIGSARVDGPLGCSLKPDANSAQVDPGGTVRALVRTQLTATGIGADLPGVGVPHGSTSVTVDSAGSSAVIDMSLPCFTEPRLLAGLGGSASLSGISLPAASDSRLADYADGKCPSGWGTGVLPGARLTYAAVPLADDPSLGYASGDPRRAWWMDGWSLESGPDDRVTAAVARLLGEVTPVYSDKLGADSPSGTSGRTFTVDEPASRADGRIPDHPLAVGARFRRRTCSKIILDPVTGPRHKGDPSILASGALGAGSLTLSPAPNCSIPGLGGDYAPGTKVTVTAMDPPGLQGSSVLTELQHPGAYDGTLDLSSYANGGDNAPAPNIGDGAPAAAPATPSTPHARPPRVRVAAAVAAADTAAWPGREARAQRSKRPRPPKRRPGGGRTGKPNGVLKHRSTTARPHTHRLTIPPAAVRLPSSRTGTDGARAVVATAKSRLARADSQLASAMGRERAKRRALERSERGRKANRGLELKWGHSYGVAAQAYAADLQARSELAAAILKGVQQAGLARLAAAGPPLDYDAEVVVRRRLIVQIAQAGHGYAGWQVNTLSQVLRALTTGSSIRRVLGARLAVARSSRTDATRQLASARAELFKAVALAGPRYVAAAAQAVRSIMARPAPHRAIAFMASGRPLYPDEQPTAADQVRTPVVFRGMWGPLFDDPGPSGAVTSHQATFTVGGADQTVHATWTPTTCERPAVQKVWSDQQFTVSIDGGGGTCAGPGTVRRFGAFAVTVDAPGTTVPVLVSTGTTPSGDTEQRMAIGGSAMFLALPNTTVKVSLCQPIEFGGALTDTGLPDQHIPYAGANGTTFYRTAPGRPAFSQLLHQDAIEPYVDSGESCGVPGLFRAGSQVHFKTPLAMAGTSVTWSVDGQSQGSLAPTVTLDDQHPEHAVAFHDTATCVQAYFKEEYYTYPTSLNLAPVLSPDPNCPVQRDAYSKAQVRDVYSGSEHAGETLAYYLRGSGSSGAVPQVSFVGHGNCGIQDNRWNLQPGGQSLLSDRNWRNDYYSTESLSLEYYDVAAEAQLCNGAAEAARHKSDCELFCIPSPPYSSLGDLIVLSEGQSFAPYVTQLVNVLTTNPFSSLDAFRNMAENLAVFGASLVVGPEVLLAAPSVLNFVHTTVGNLGDLQDPANFGRFAASFATSLGVAGVQTYLAKGTTLLSLAGADAILAEGADLLDSAGAPTGLTKLIRSLRILTNGMSGLGSCASGAAAGNPPPIPADTLSGADVAKLYLGGKAEAKKYLDGGDPVPLVSSGGEQGGTNVLQQAQLTRYSQMKTALGSNVKSSLVGTLASFQGTGHNWTPDEFLGCLASQTIG